MSEKASRGAEKPLHRGDEVTWESSQGTVHGVVEKKLTTKTKIKGHTVAATPDHPEYLVKSDATGAQAAHEPDALKRDRR